MRPAFQHQGPSTNCVIGQLELGWVSCTAYAMAMLIDAATDGRQRPKGCKVRRLIRPEDTVRGLTLGQVATVAEEAFGVPIALRAGPNVISVAGAVRRLRAGRGFVLQGNNLAWGMGDVNHAVYVHEVRGGTDEAPEDGLLYDPQRRHERWMPWSKILAFGAALRMDDGRPLGPNVLYAGFAPRPTTRVATAEAPAGASPAALAAPDRGPSPPRVVLRFGAKKLPKPDRTVAQPPRGRLVNVRGTPKSLARSTVVDTLAKGEAFVAHQRTRGVTPPGAASATWYGNRDGTQWVHLSGLRRIGPDVRARGAGGLGIQPLLPPGDHPADHGVDPVDEPAALDPSDPGAAVPAPTDALEEAPGRDDMDPDIANDAIDEAGVAPVITAAASDPDPAAPEAAFPGRPLTDAEIDALSADDDPDD